MGITFFSVPWVGNEVNPHNTAFYMSPAGLSRKQTTMLVVDSSPRECLLSLPQASAHGSSLQTWLTVLLQGPFLELLDPQCISSAERPALPLPYFTAHRKEFPRCGLLLKLV